MRACGWGGGEPILVGGLTYIGRHRDLYRSIYRPVVGEAQAAEVSSCLLPFSTNGRDDNQRYR